MPLHFAIFNIFTSEFRISCWILISLLFSGRERRLRRRSGAAGEHFEILMPKCKILLIKIINLTDPGAPDRFTPLTPLTPLVKS